MEEDSEKNSMVPNLECIAKIHRFNYDICCHRNIVFHLSLKFMIDVDT